MKKYAPRRPINNFLSRFQDTIKPQLQERHFYMNSNHLFLHDPSGATQIIYVPEAFFVDRKFDHLYK